MPLTQSGTMYSLQNGERKKERKAARKRADLSLSLKVAGWSAYCVFSQKTVLPTVSKGNKNSLKWAGSQAEVVAEAASSSNQPLGESAEAGSSSDSSSAFDVIELLQETEILIGKSQKRFATDVRL